MKRHLLLSVITLLAYAALPAQERPVSVSYMAGMGSAHITDAYLSPFPTEGWGSALIYERSQALRSRPDLWTGLMQIELDLARTHNHATTNGTMWGADLIVDLAALRRFAPLPCDLRLAIGPEIELLAGAHYRPGNGNNPVGAQVALTAGVTGRAGFPVRIGRLPIDLSFRPSLQLTGLFLAPQYGQLYYEIYEGDSSGLARFAWPGNRLAYSHLLAADLRLGATSLRLGYSLRLSTREASHLAVNTSTHLLVVGITTDFITLNRRHPQPLGESRPIYSF